MLYEEVGTRNGNYLGCSKHYCVVNPQAKLLSTCMSIRFSGTIALYGAFSQGPHNLVEKQT